MGEQGILTLFVEMIRPFLWDVRAGWIQTFQKIRVFTVTIFSPFFFAISGVANLKEQSIAVHKVF